MHRNAEIWTKRHERMEEIRRQSSRHLTQTLGVAKDEAEDFKIRRNASIWIGRWSRIQERVWHALCVAKGWRKA